MSIEKQEEKQKHEQHQKINRRNFLKAGAASAISMGVLGMANALPVQAAETVTNSAGQSKLHPTNYGLASVKMADFNDQWLGTTKIVGPIKKFHEANQGFNLVFRHKVSEAAFKANMFYHAAAKYPLGDALAKFTLSLAPMVSGKPAPEKLAIPDPEQMSQHIKDCAYFLRADEVGIGKMPSFAYYEFKAPPLADMMKDDLSKSVPVTESLPYVIVVMTDQHLETMMASTGYDGISGSQSFRSYHATAVISVILANYIRNLGYNARAHHFSNYALILAPCMVSAGLGEMTRTGDCIAHPTLGFRNKAAAVTTDLPLAPDRPIDFGAQDFCRVCKKCADNCPSGAITQDEDYIEKNGILRWQSDIKKCVEFRVTNKEGSMCGRCMKVCPWNSKEDSWFHQAGTFIGSQGETASSLLKSIDDIFGYGTEQIEKYKWWLEWPERY
ncbi:reductive dehalogenase [Dehalobacter sp. TBBPA1]|uniref:reductive dehalogenase n=1 Tax=Dehalobacter sp. TBBPA1 TaxID=3235037 RepID=UPI0034A442CD